MKKIMVVDDEKDLLAIAKSYLKREGHDVAVTTSCDEAMKILPAFNPDIIYMDINVGPEDGRVTCQQIKSLAAHQHIPIILISANYDALNTYKDYQANGILKKPFQPIQLLSLMASHLPSP